MPFDRRQFLAAAAAGVSLGCSARTLLAAPADQAEAAESIRTVTGEIADSRERPGLPAGILGRSGCLVIRSAERWNHWRQSLHNQGFRFRDGHALSDVDFARNNVLVVNHFGDQRDKLALRELRLSDSVATVQVVMSYIIYKQRDMAVDKFQFLALATPKRKTIDVSVSTYHPYNGGPHPTIDRAKLEWSHSFAADAGDVVDGLTARLRPEANRVAAGDDIRLAFELQFATACREGFRYCRPAESALVWDGKYSNGYRNHAFLVQTPDGKSKLLRPAVIRGWDKNAPHPVEISVGKPYVLPEWQEGVTFKSLKRLGLDTSPAGKYVVTGLYEEHGSEFDGKSMWGGQIATAPVTIEVV